MTTPTHGSGGGATPVAEADRNLTHAEAEAIFGSRLDRRRQYRLIDGKVCRLLDLGCRSCTGCCETGDYGSGSEHYPVHPKWRCLVGSGCSECGHTGIRREFWWHPEEQSREDDKWKDEP